MQLQTDINQFTRKIKLKAHFNQNEKQARNEATENAKPPFRIKNHSSNWEPDKIHHTVKTFIESLRNEIDSQPKSSQINKQNLTKKELIALKDLSEQQDIIITNADKGGAVVIQSVNDYIKEANRQLEDPTYYKRTTMNLTEKHNKTINNTINSFEENNLLSKSTASMLRTSEPKTPKFYILLKIHKPGNPGRPVISSINCHTARIS